MTQLMPNMWIIMFMVSMSTFFINLSINYFDYNMLMKINYKKLNNKW